MSGETLNMFHDIQMFAKVHLSRGQRIHTYQVACFELHDPVKRKNSMEYMSGSYLKLTIVLLIP